jgi:phosphoribosylglycinamide formyltransferase 1
LTASGCRTAILISGSGTNLQAFIDRAASGGSALELCGVFSNRNEAFGLERARRAGIPTACIDHAGFDSRDAFDRAVAAALEPWQPRLLVLAGFMRILSPWFVDRYRGRILNVHPALLPAYPGLDTHRRALAAGETHHGSTVHFVTEQLDGGPRILQGRLSVDPAESPDALQSRVQSIEHKIYPEAAEWFAQGRLDCRDGAAWLDGKPLPEPVILDFDTRGKRL